MPPSALVLFDIDGTLLPTTPGPHHRDALIHAVHAVTGIETSMEDVAVAGMLDGDIVRQMLQNRGASLALIRRSMPAILARSQSIYARTCPDLRRRVCPGARMLLYKLSRRSIVTGLVTGNFTRIGWKKMERARSSVLISDSGRSPNRLAIARDWSASRLMKLARKAGSTPPAPSL